MLTAVGAAVAAAALFAVASALQHRSASQIPKLGAVRHRDVIRYVVSTLRHRVWLAGTAADAFGLALHALALHSGPLTLVQPLLVTGLVFALPLRQWLDHRRPGRREVATAAVLAAGLTLFLVAATPAEATTSPADHLPVLVTVLAIGVAVSGAVWLGRQSSGSVSAAAFGVAAGLSFAATAALLKATTNAFANGPVAALSSWSLYALVAVGAVGLLCNQLAFQAGPLRASLPAIATIDPLVSLVIGVAVYDEALRSGLAASSIELVGLAVVVWATVSLSRLQPQDEPEATSPQPRS